MYIIFMHIAYHYNYNERPISLASLQAYKLTGPGLVICMQIQEQNKYIQVKVVTRTNQNLLASCTLINWILGNKQVN